ARAVSTITQQTAKNLFLWPRRSFVRKALELPPALWIDFVLPKRRVLEMYLKIAEWGPNGQVGADGGTRYAFSQCVHPPTPPAARGGAAGRGAAEPAAAQRQAAGAGGAPARPDLRGPRRGPGGARLLRENRQMTKVLASSPLELEFSL